MRIDETTFRISACQKLYNTSISQFSQHLPPLPQLVFSSFTFSSSRRDSHFCPACYLCKVLRQWDWNGRIYRVNKRNASRQSKSTLRCRRSNAFCWCGRYHNAAMLNESLRGCYNKGYERFRIWDMCKVVVVCVAYYKDVVPKRVSSLSYACVKSIWSWRKKCGEKLLINLPSCENLKNRLPLDNQLYFISLEGRHIEI